jgi:hypothetical protein
LRGIEKFGLIPLAPFKKEEYFQALKIFRGINFSKPQITPPWRMGLKKFSVIPLAPFNKDGMLSYIKDFSWY